LGDGADCAQPQQLDDKSVIETNGMRVQYREDLSHLREQVENRQFSLGRAAAHVPGASELNFDGYYSETVADAVNKVASARGKGTFANIMAFGGR
jgi:hypothetical protein